MASAASADSDIDMLVVFDEPGPPSEVPKLRANEYMDAFINPEEYLEAQKLKREAKKANRNQTPSLQVGKKLGEPDEFIVSWGYGK